MFDRSLALAIVEQIATLMNRETKPNRLGVWGHGMLNDLPSVSRKRRKRQASKKRRALLKTDDDR